MNVTLFMNQRFLKLVPVCVAFLCGTSLLYGEASSRQIIAGDRLQIDVQEQTDLKAIYPVAGDGTIDFAMLGRVEIAELTTREAERKIKQLLESSYFKKATVSVSISDFVQGQILVLGAVNDPQAIPFIGGQILTLMEVISLCGGMNSEAAGTEVRILRWKTDGGVSRQVLTIDVQTMFEKLDFSQDQFLRPRDIVYVPSMGEGGSGRREFLALGRVGKPGFHPYTENLDVVRMLSKIGGVTLEAKWDSCKILRPKGDDKYESIHIDLSLLVGMADMRHNIKIEPNDIFFVPSADQVSRGMVYVLGAVENPGSRVLPMNNEASLARFLLSDIRTTKFANLSKVKIIRVDITGSKQTLTIDVADMLKTGNFEGDVPLMDGDVLQIPEKVLGF